MTGPPKGVRAHITVNRPEAQELADLLERDGFAIGAVRRDDGTDILCVRLAGRDQANELLVTMRKLKQPCARRLAREARSFETRDGAVFITWPEIGVTTEMVN